MKKTNHTKTSILTLALFCVSLCGLAADVPKSKDQQNIQGDWVGESGTSNGFKLEEVVGCHYVFSGDRLAIRDKTGKEMKFSFKLDTSSSPKLLVQQPEQALTNATLCNVAYELNGDTLKIAIANPGTRPTGMSDKEQMVIIFKRKKM